MSIFYKLRHKPTGLFFKPSKYGSRSHLSKDGKVYHRKPSFKLIGGRIKVPKEGCSYHTVTVHTPIEDWELVPFTVLEATPEPLKP